MTGMDGARESTRPARRTTMMSYEPGTRVKQIGGGRRTGTITEGIWGGYVTIKWDTTCKEESGVHIADIKPA